MDEFSIINNYFRPLTDNCYESQSLEDDTCLINQANLVISKDLMVENIHFKRSDGAYNIANRLIRSNLSDIAASGCKPLYYMLGIAKNDHVNEEFLSQFCLALKEINEEFNIKLIGGDTVKSNQDLFFSITIFGQKEKNILSRKNALNDDLIFVSGYIGDAFLGRKISEGEIILEKEENKKYLLDRYYKAQPRIELARQLNQQSLSKCAIDVSDGLLSDIRQICCSSKLSAEVFLNQIPISQAAQNILQNNQDFSRLDLCSAGDDYEIVFSAKKSDLENIKKLSKQLNIPLTHIGCFKNNISNKSSIKLLDASKNKIDFTKFGYEH